MSDNKVVQMGRVKLVITAYGETTPPEELRIYAHAVKFLAYWMQKQDGAMGSDTEALFEELKTNVCKAMMGETKGSG